MPEAKTTIKAESSLKQIEIPLQTVQVSHRAGPGKQDSRGWNPKTPQGLPIEISLSMLLQPLRLYFD